MKTLVVFTDLTIRAEHTAFYTLDLARQIKADILLCHVLPLPDNGIESEAEHPDHADAMYDVTEFAGRLKQRAVRSSLNGQFIPKIECCIKTGTMSSALNDVASEYDILMAVISTHRWNKVTALLMGSNTIELIDNTNFPVLVVPYETKYQGLATMIFATDLDSKGLNALYSLSVLAECTGSEILITHVTNKKLIDRSKNPSLINFFDSVSASISYPKKRYKLINDSKVINGLKKLPQKTGADLIAIVHRKRNYLERLFGTSLSLLAVGRLAKPILIFPRHLA